MTQYEMTLLTKTEPDKDAVKDLIVKTGGEVTDERPLGQRPLAYPIKKEKRAYFTLLRFKIDPESLLALNKELLLSGNVLRQMVTTAKARVPVAAIVERAAVKSAPEGTAPEKTPGMIRTAAADTEPAAATKPVKKTKEQIKAEKQAAESRQKKIEAELEKILSEE